MKYNPQIHHRQSIRLSGYDYSGDNYYFVTVCTYRRECILGEIVDGKMILNDCGKIANKEWQQTGKIRRNIIIDEYIIMPNHMHGILLIENNYCRGTLLRALPAQYIQNTNHENMNPNQPQGTQHPNMPPQGTQHPNMPPQGTQQRAPTNEKFGKPTSNTIPSIIRGYKSAVSTKINTLRNTPGIKIWQRNYYEHIIRDDYALNNIRNYIQNNPKIWHRDRNNI
ncbi:MAG: transposase [Patescibacteria group bacterium]